MTANRMGMAARNVMKAPTQPKSLHPSIALIIKSNVLRNHGEDSP